MGTIDPRDAIPLTDEGKRLQEEYRQRMKETLAEIPTFDAEQMRKDIIRIHSDAIHQMGGDPVQRSYVDALTERLAAAEQRANDAEATLATIGGADKATLARKLRRANAATRDAEQRAAESEAQVARLRAIEEAARELMAFPDVTYMLVTDDYTEQERQNIDNRWQKVEDFLKAALTAPATQPDERAAKERANGDAMALFDEDNRYFDERAEQIIARFPEEWVAIYHKTVVGHDLSLDGLIDSLIRDGLPVGTVAVRCATFDPPLILLALDATDGAAKETHHARIAHVGAAVAAQCAAKEGTRLSADS